MMFLSVINSCTEGLSLTGNGEGRTKYYIELEVVLEVDVGGVV